MTDTFEFNAERFQNTKHASRCVRCEGTFEYCFTSCKTAHHVLYANGNMNRVCHFCTYVIEQVPLRDVPEEIRHLVKAKTWNEDKGG
jgi:hypothetical protein